jgi:ATP-dependent DNA helicase RecQ
MSRRLDGSREFLSSFHRPNLHLTAAAKLSESAQLLEFLDRHKGECGIVYCGSRAKTERTAQRLSERGIPAIAFHAGLDPRHKRESLARFRSGEPLVVVATIAFGMGIDRPDVRFVVHLDMPDSPEAYYQQIGRAGRDGDPSETLMLFGGQDIAQARHWLAQSSASEAQVRVMRTKLEEMVALTEAVSCRTRTLLACFGEAFDGACGHCDNCAAPPVTADATVDAQKALSAVYRTGQLFGAIHIVAVLRGESPESVLRHGHDRLPVFGVGADRSAVYWRALIRQLIALRALDVDTQGHGGLFLVEEEARPILRGERRVIMRQEEAARTRRAERPSRRGGRPAAEMPSTPEAMGLFETLRAWRAQAAKDQSVPPYVIFHDSVLREIAAVRPATLDELGQIKGVGASKLERYGASVLALARG